MTDDTNSYTGAGDSDAATRSTLAGGAKALRDTGAELGRAASVAIEATRSSVAKGLDIVGQGLHDAAESMATGGTHVGRGARGVAESVESASRYVRGHDAKAIGADFRTLVQAHPGKSLLAALTLGYFTGLALQRAFRR